MPWSRLWRAFTHLRKSSLIRFTMIMILNYSFLVSMMLKVPCCHHMRVTQNYWVIPDRVYLKTIYSLLRYFPKGTIRWRWRRRTSRRSCLGRRTLVLLLCGFVKWLTVSSEANSFWRHHSDFFQRIRRSLWRHMNNQLLLRRKGVGKLCQCRVTFQKFTDFFMTRALLHEVVTTTQ